MLTFVGPYSQCLSVAGISLFRQASAQSFDTFQIPRLIRSFFCP